MNERPGPHLEGGFFQVRFDYVREYYGYEAVAELLAALLAPGGGARAAA